MGRFEGPTGTHWSIAETIPFSKSSLAIKFYGEFFDFISYKRVLLLNKNFQKLSNAISSSVVERSSSIEVRSSSIEVRSSSIEDSSSSIEYRSSSIEYRSSSVKYWSPSSIKYWSSSIKYWSSSIREDYNKTYSLFCYKYL